MKYVLLVCTILLFGIQSNAQLLGTQLVYWDFANGIPAGFQNGSNSGIATWEYRGPSTTPNNTICSRGSCGAGTLPIASNSLANGFVIFDSNYWDDDDNMCGGLGTGQDPAPHTAWLITEPINLSSATGAVITFQQQVRMFQATTKVQISINGGVNWTDIIVNSANVSPTAEWKTGNISAIAVGQSDVRFRFLFTGTYYHWCIDDIYVYQPNQNDAMLNSATYTLFGTAGLPSPISGMEYDQYPTFMIPQFNFKSKATNIGSQAATNVLVNVKVLNQASTQLYSQNSNTVGTLNPGIQSNFAITSPYNPPTTLGDYRIAYSLNLQQADQNQANNRDTLDFTITSNTYARDEGPMQNVFTPQAAYVGQRQHVGNLYEIRADGFQLNSIGVAVGTGTAPGTVIKGYVYNDAMSVIFAETVPYTINQADISALGEEKIINLPLETVFPVFMDSVYCIMAGNVDGSQALRVCRSGASPDNTSFVKYPDSFGLFYLLTTPVVRMNLYPLGTISGCTDPTAANYNPDASLSDGFCLFPGCTILGADNYDPAANFDDGSCIYEGCTNSAADNYNPLATVDDGSCIISGCTNPVADNYDPEATIENGSCLISGCTNLDAVNFNPFANVDDGSCVLVGCTDPLAANYDVQANQDDGSCIYPGCTDPEADNFNSGANQEDGSCIYTIAALFTFDLGGCAPYAVNIINQTVIVPESECVLTISDGTEITECLSNYTHVFPEPGEYFITLIYTTGTGSSTDIIGPIVVSGFPEAPIFSEIDDNLICSNCSSDQLTWSVNGEELPNTNGSSLSVLSDGIYQNGYYILTVANQAGCSTESDAVLVLHAQFTVTPLFGCIPFEVSIDDLTSTFGGMVCTFTVNGESLISSGEPIALPIIEVGIQDIILSCEVDGVIAEMVQSIEGFEATTPELSFNELTNQVECSNCDGLSSEWSVDGSIVASDVNAIEVNGELFVVTLTGDGGCEASSVLTVITVTEQNSLSLKLFPNPSNEVCTVESTFNGRFVTITDPSGRVLDRIEVFGKRFVIDTSILSSGLYFIHVEGSGISASQRISIVH